MKRLITPSLIVILAFTVLTALSQAQPYPSNRVANFFDSTSLYNGVPVPIGSIIRAYDPDGVLSGVDTFGVDPAAAAGFFGFMNVYGDQPETPGVDEGPIEGDTVDFTINGRPATVVTGDPTWHFQALPARVQLSAGGAIVAMTITEVPTDTLATYNRVYRFTVGVRNDGNGEDFYHILTLHSDTAFKSIAQDSFVYADSGETVFVNFDVQTPFFASTPDTIDVIQFTVNSGVDPSVQYSGSVDLIFSITDVLDGGGLLPGGFALHQNFPNPFNPSTTISFELPRATNVRLEIFDMLGRVIESRDLGVRSAGDHLVAYDATGLSSGMYFYRIVTDYAEQTRKMLLVK